ncbi:class I SAM-dependent methyltransferase [Actinomyces urinae]|uniref:class I SAM-dependent methyltransferase n=1 Tax=Actinomyces urinae TaxID=1689268 RepID=UPI000931BD20|nr:methyltransferase [Actinomyces urinae]
MTKHYFSNSPEATVDELRPLILDVRGVHLDMVVSDSVFSSHKLDLGTKALLLEAPEPPETGTFLDLGCGWGPIGVTLGKLSPKATIWAVDINQRALDLTRKNAKRNQVKLVSQLADKALEEATNDGIKFDLIWSNPPIRIGKPALQEMLTKWLGLLSDEGEAWLVVARNLGADSLIKWLNEQGWQAEKAHSKKGYRIIRVCR